VPQSPSTPAMSREKRGDYKNIAFVPSASLIIVNKNIVKRYY
jgi:hypothetical protein